MKIQGNDMNNRDDVYFEVIHALNDLGEVEAFLDCDSFGLLWVRWDGYVWKKKWFDKPVKLTQLFLDVANKEKE